MWHGLELAQFVADGLARAEQELSREQAVSGLDALDEVSLHGVLERILSESGFGLLREVPYPSLTPEQKRDPQRKRCDFVLTPERGQRIRDALANRRRKTPEPTLFAAADTEHSEADPTDCYWIEVKCVGQFTCTHDVPGPNTTYASELINAVRKDTAKLAGDALIARGVLLLLLFCETRAIAEHDLAVAANRTLDRGGSLGQVRLRCASIPDRIGNRLVTAATFEMNRAD